MTTAVSLSHVSCVFGNAAKPVKAVDDVSLNIQAGEFFTLLGPSGSGKTTCLRMIGGFTLPTTGEIKIHGQDVSQLPPYARPVNTVFQDYALFPHMSILDNVAYALMVRGVDKPTRHAKARELLDMVRLPDVADRKPGQLSGGQRQRIALARALISEPKVLLLDEPLGALDLKLREQMQSELKSLQRKLGITFIFVTHDQHEALSMSDRIGVFSQGRLEQVATPTDLYNRPQTQFVAEFVGTANMLRDAEALLHAGKPLAMLRPEHIALSSSDDANATGTVAELQYFGSFVRMRLVRTGGTDMLVDVPSTQAPPDVGSQAFVRWSRNAVCGIAPAEPLKAAA
jgi:putative spermidine/putrescine transport system ATP-binding protein